MRMKKLPFNLIILIVLGFVSTAALISCSLPVFRGGDNTPTPNVTQAYQTVNAKLTLSVAQTPSSTEGLTATQTKLVNQTPTQVTPSPSSTQTRIPETPSPRCNLAAPGVPIDVTIPDNTQFPPGQEFTKTWRLQNVGECTWSTEYALVFYSGEQMSALARVPLPGEVGPGKIVDISVDMVAPQLPGTYQGYWKISTASGFEFGIGTNGDEPFWVKIIVLDLPTQTPTTTPATPSTTPTPGISASSTLDLLPGDTLDLDTGIPGTGGADDLSYENAAQGVHQLKTIGTALLGVYGDSKPEFVNCQATNPNATFLNVEALPAGTYLCYVTNTGAIGRAMISNFNPGNAVLTLDILTWTYP